MCMGLRNLPRLLGERDGMQISRCDQRGSSAEPTVVAAPMMNRPGSILNDLAEWVVSMKMCAAFWRHWV
jgi:hypothetical protein